MKRKKTTTLDYQGGWIKLKFGVLQATIQHVIEFIRI